MPYSNTRVILNAGGPPSRYWADHTGAPKHLVAVPTPNGGQQPLLVRTIHQLVSRGITDIRLICDCTDPRYNLDGVIRYDHIPATVGVQSLIHGSILWSTYGRTVSLMGDWFYTKDCLDRILARGEAREWLHLARIGRSTVNGQPWSEDAGVSFWPEHHDAYLQAIHDIDALSRAGAIPRAGAWEVWCRMAGLNGPEVHTMLDTPEVLTLGHRIVLPDDGSSDFDLPVYFDTWSTAVAEGWVSLAY